MEGNRAVRRIGAIGDIHCEDESLAAVLAFLSKADVDATLAVGDIIDGTGDADRCCAMLADHGVIAVRGNHERWLLTGEQRNIPNATTELSASARTYIESLPVTREFETPAGRLMLCHGIGEDDMAHLGPETQGFALQEIFSLPELLKRTDLKFTLGGHTHRRMVRRIAELTILNAGTLLRTHEPCFMVADFEQRNVQFYDVQPDARIVSAQLLPLD